MRNTIRALSAILLTTWAAHGAFAQGDNQAAESPPKSDAAPQQAGQSGQADQTGQSAAPAQQTTPATAQEQQAQQAQQAAQAQLGIEKKGPQESLMDIYQRALQNDPTIRAAEASYQASAEAKPQARARIFPSLSFSANRSGSFDKSPYGQALPTGDVFGTSSESTSSQHGVSVTLSQTLFDWSKFASLKQADKQVAQAQADYESAKQDLMLRVATAYFGVLAAQDTLQAAVAARDSVSQQLEQAQRRFDVGLIAITDVQESQAGYDARVADVIQAQQALATAQESLRQIIGQLVTNLAGPSGNLPLQTPNPTNANQWVQTALKQNLQLISSRLAADIAQDNITIQRASRLPTLSLSTSYSKTVSERTSTLNGLVDPNTGQIYNSVRPFSSAPQGYSWQIDLQVPIYTGGANGSRIRQSVYQQRAAQQQAEATARQTEQQTRDAYLGVISEISRVKALRQSVQSNETALRAARAGFQVGTRTTVDVLTAENNLQQARTNYAASRYDYILNELKLKQAAGILSIDDIQQVEGWLK
jgi:outer membrane protein